MGDYTFPVRNITYEDKEDAGIMAQDEEARKRICREYWIIEEIGENYGNNYNTGFI